MPPLRSILTVPSSLPMPVKTLVKFCVIFGVKSLLHAMSHSFTPSSTMYYSMSAVHLVLRVMLVRPFSSFIPLLGSVCSPCVVCIRVGFCIRIVSQCTEIMSSFSISDRLSKAVSHSII